MNNAMARGAEKSSKIDAEKKIYLFGLVTFALVRIYFIFSAGSFNAHVISDILFFAIMIFMIIVVKNLLYVSL